MTQQTYYYNYVAQKLNNYRSECMNLVEASDRQSLLSQLFGGQTFLHVHLLLICVFLSTKKQHLKGLEKQTNNKKNVGECVYCDSDAT